VVEQTDIERLVGELEIAVDRLRSLYDQYFMGIEKLEPTVPRKDVDRRIYALRKEQIRNTAQRFRFQMLLQRYNTYQSHWQRICRDIENGTYKRHLIRAQQRFGPKRPSGRPPPASPLAARTFADELAELDREFAPAETLDDGDVELEEEALTTPRRRSGGGRTPDSSRPPVPPPAPTRAHPPRPARASSPRISRPPPSSRSPPSPRTSAARTPTVPRPDPRAGAPPSSRPPSSPSRATPPRPPAMAPREGAPPPAPPPRAHRPVELPEDRVRQLYSQYIEAKRRQNESTAAITYDAVARSLRESSAKLRQRLGKPVDFEVAVKDGRAIIRPVVK
jgi:hypothetical protein